MFHNDKDVDCRFLIFANISNYYDYVRKPVAECKKCMKLGDLISSRRIAGKIRISLRCNICHWQKSYELPDEETLEYNRQLFEKIKAPMKKV